MTTRRFPGLSRIPAVATALQWESLAFLRAIGLLRLGYFGTVLIPIYAYFVQAWNAWAVAHPPAVALLLPFSIFTSFLGSVLLSVAQLLNEVFCPKIIKIHGTLHGFQGYLREHVVNERVIAEAALIAQEGRVDARSRTRLPELDESDRQNLVKALAEVLVEIQARGTPAATEHAAQSAGQSVMTYQSVWDQSNNAFWPVRWIIGLCYVLAAAIAAFLIAVQIPHMFRLVASAV